MDQIGIGRPDISQPGGAQTQTKIHIIETDADVYFIQTAGLFENVATHDQTCAGNGGTILLQPGTIEIAGMSARNSRESVARHSAQAENNAAVLKSPVGIPETRADRTDSDAHGVTYHFA